MRQSVLDKIAEKESYLPAAEKRAERKRTNIYFAQHPSSYRENLQL